MWISDERISIICKEVREITFYKKGPFHCPRNHIVCPQWTQVRQKPVLPRKAAPAIASASF